MIKVLGHHKYKEALDPLYQQLQKLDLSYEEETALSHALLSIEKHPREDLKKKCLKSARSSLRNYAIDVYLHRMKEEAWPLILPLIKDPSLFVRKKILLSAVFHHAPKPELVKYKSTLEEYLHSHFADLSLLSAFTLLKLDHPEAPKILRKRVLSPIVDEAIFAAALWALGKEKMHQSSFELFDEIQNPYVKMTLGMGLMRRGECNDKIKDFFVQFLKNHRELIMIESHEDFPILMVKPSTIKHNLGVANYPKYLDMNFRLYLLNLLATYDPKAASRFVAEFAFADMTGVSVHAMAILLQEAKYSRLDWLENLLENEQEEIRLRAALCLCMFGRFDETIFTILQEAYHKKTWEKKIELLETIAFNADQKYVPFLFDRLEESSGILRSIAASGIIQCLYH